MVDVIWKVCDAHLPEQHTAQHYRIRIESPNLPAELTRNGLIDLCDDEASRVLAPLLELMAKHGRPTLPEANGSATKQRFHCIPCGKAWKYKQSKTHHDTKYHDGKDVNPPDQLGTDTTIAPMIEASTKPSTEQASTQSDAPVEVARIGDRYQCPWCDKTRAHPRDLRKHVEKYHREHASELDGTVAARKRELHQRQCPLCDTVTGSPQGLNSHLRTGHGASPAEMNLHYCRHCPKTFTGKTAAAKRNGHESSHGRTRQKTESEQQDADSTTGE